MTYGADIKCDWLIYGKVCIPQVSLKSEGVLILLC